MSKKIKTKLNENSVFTLAKLPIINNEYSFKKTHTKYLKIHFEEAINALIFFYGAGGGVCVF